jgi:hypothetical protein
MVTVQIVKMETTKVEPVETAEEKLARLRSHFAALRSFFTTAISVLEEELEQTAELVKRTQVFEEEDGHRPEPG